ISANRALISSSVFRFDFGNGSSSSISRRSARSPRRASVAIPVMMMQRRNDDTDRFESVYRDRPTTPSPVTARHIASENHSGMLEMLSMAEIQHPAAAVNH